ncbi:MAG: N-formylglutamate amidohydrolase [Actinobacteria bacterium]|nr:N-formylglutamate amidohydrolase [Actinomycetota bacterium]
MAEVNFEIFEGDQNSSVILHVPHSSRVIPEDIRAEILLNDANLEAELDEITDSRTDFLAERAAIGARIKPSIFMNRLSRLVIDPERFPDDREVMNEIGMGAVYLKTSTGRDLRRVNKTRDQLMIDRFFTPYSQALEDLVRSRLRVNGFVTIVDVHSYRMIEHPNGVNKGQRRPPVCLGVDDFHTPDWLCELATESFSQVGEVVINEPYSGTYVPLSLYESENRVSSVMMENREDVLSPQEIEGTIDALTALIDGIEAARAREK